MQKLKLRSRSFLVYNIEQKKGLELKEGGGGKESMVTCCDITKCKNAISTYSPQSSTTLVLLVEIVKVSELLITSSKEEDENYL